jgi:3,4-dihydroxy 2-butanone 4-phosphate synthase/GTP cyclohydrolase II
MIDQLKNKVSIYAETNLPTIHGEFKVIVFRNTVDHKEHLAIVKGEIGDGKNIPVRLHSECLTSEVLGSLKCDCREQLEAAFQYIAAEGRGIILYLRQEGRGIGLGNKIRAYALQEQGFDTVEANHILGFPDDLRRYDTAAAMLHTLGVKSIQLLTNNPKKISGLEEWGIDMVERIPVVIQPNAVNRDYLHTKTKKSGHLMEIAEPYLNVDMAS